MYSHSSQKSIMDIPISMSKNLAFDPNAPLTMAEQHPEHSPRRFRSCSPVCQHLVFTRSVDESPARTSDPYFCHHSLLQGRAESPSPLQHHMYYHHTSTPSADDPFHDATAEEEEDFSTAPLDDDIWLEDPVPDRHLYIHEQPQPHFQCSYPCPYSLDLPQFHSRRCTSTVL